MTLHINNFPVTIILLKTSLEALSLVLLFPYRIKNIKNLDYPRNERSNTDTLEAHILQKERGHNISQQTR
jgi:hypothetical protein